MAKSFPVEKYLKADVMTELGLADVTPEERVRFLESFGSVIYKRLILRLMEELSEGQKDQLETLLAQHPDDADALGRFLVAEVPTFGAMVEEEVAKYKKELIDRMKAR